MLGRVRKRVKSWIDRHFIGLSITGLLLLFVFFYFAENIFITIPPGYGGVLWLRFLGGTVLGFHYGEGLRIIPPWDKIYLYDLRICQESEQFDILTKEGLQMSVNATLRFRLNPNALGAITAFAGPDFVKTLVMPSVGATARLEAAKHTAEEIYSTRRHEIESDILLELTQAVDNLIQRSDHEEKPEILVEDFWFRSITLPHDLQASVEAKLTQRELAEQYIYILKREERERERKTIEAQGIKAFQDIVSSGISENYLRWKGIDATLKLAESPNSKIVIIGGKDGMPLILGPLDSSQGGAGPASIDKPGPARPAPVNTSTPSSSHSAATTATPASAQPYLHAAGMPAQPLALDRPLPAQDPPPARSVAGKPQNR